MSTGLPGVGIFGTSPAALLLVPALKVLQEWVYVGQRQASLGERTVHESISVCQMEKWRNIELWILKRLTDGKGL